MHTLVENIALGEFDLGGVLYHANYFHLYERAREAYLRKAGCPYADLVQHGFHLAVVEAHQQFLKPIYYGPEVTIQLTTVKLTVTSVTFSYRILQNSALVHTAWSRHALVEKANDGFRVVKFPDTVADVLRQIVE